MHIEISTLFDKGDAVETKDYGSGVITAVSVRFLILPNGEREEDISYFVRFDGKEYVIDQADLHRKTDDKNPGQE